MKIKPTLLVFLLGACAWQASAQPAFDNSGDIMLYGTYYMRQVFYYYVPGQTNDLGDTINIQGNISFSGYGTYTFTGSVLDSAVSSTKAETFTQNGTYVISASGEGYISAVDQEFPNDRISGLVAHDIFIGSSSDNLANYNDLFICVPIGTGATNSTLNGAYTVAYFDPTFPGDALFTMTADGQGNIGTVNATDYLNSSSTSSTQSLSGVTYSFSNGAAQLKLGGKRDSSTLLAGTELLYVSPDGNFVFGGSYDGWDMFVGVRAATSAPSNYGGLYYQAGLNLDESATNSGYSPLDSYYGAFQASAGKIVGHQRLSTASPINYQGVSSLLTYGGSGSFTYSDSYTLNSDGSSDDSCICPALCEHLGRNHSHRIWHWPLPLAQCGCAGPGVERVWGISEPGGRGERRQFRALHFAGVSRRISYLLRIGAGSHHRQRERAFSGRVPRGAGDD